MTSSELVTLRSGLVLPVVVVRLALDLEARGLHFRVDGDTLTVGPRELLTDADRTQIRLWKLHLMAMAAYDADVQAAVQ